MPSGQGSKGILSVCDNYKLRIINGDLSYDNESLKIIKMGRGYLNKDNGQKVFFSVCDNFKLRNIMKSRKEVWREPMSKSAKFLSVCDDYKLRIINWEFY